MDRALTYLGAGARAGRHLVFDPRGRVLAPADDEARWLAGDDAAERAADDRPTAIRRLSAIPGGAADGRAEVRSRHPSRTPTSSTTARPTRRVTTSPSVRRPPRPRPAAGAAVPAWDDIMFGPRRRD